MTTPDNYYLLPDLLIVSALFSTAAYFAGRIHAENAARRYAEKRDAARRRANHPTNTTRKDNTQ